MVAIYIQPMKGHITADKDVSVQIRDIVLDELGSVLRGSDMTGSFTKNEYLVFLPNCSAEHVDEIAQRIMVRIANKKIIVDDNTTYHLECKIGIASLEPSAAELKRLANRALEALDRAKEKENNVIETY